MKDDSFPIAKDGLRFVAIAAGITGICVYMNYWCLTTICSVLTLFAIYFFRNPKRDIPEGDDIITSPADGKVIGIESGAKDKEGNEGILINIFLNIFNVHVNRIPIAGKVTNVFYNPGKFLPAYREKASELNEQNSITIENDNGVKIHVKQIAGLIARRIVCWTKVGDIGFKGNRFGLIRFGSRVDIFLPKNTEISVRVGDKVKGGESVIGKLVNTKLPQSTLP